MSMNNGPAGRDDAEMIAESRLDYLLDAVEAPPPSAALRRRLYQIGARPPVASRAALWRRLGGWFAGGPALRPVGGLAALACTLLVGILVGRALPDGAAPVISPQTFVVAGLADLPAEPDPLSVDSISLVVPRGLQANVAAYTPPDDDDVGTLPLY